MSNKLQFTAFALAFGLVASACSEPAAPTADSDTGITNVATMANAGGGVIHHVSLGSNDACAAFGLPNGCDGNFSLTANMKADGSVAGQWQDAFVGGGEGIHVAVNCLNVVGNGAVIGGVITHGTAAGVDVSGQAAVTAVVDNGTSANDPADQISFSIFPAVGFDCTTFPPAAFPLFNLTTGQVKVR